MPALPVRYGPARAQALLASCIHELFLEATSYCHAADASTPRLPSKHPRQEAPIDPQNDHGTEEVLCLYGANDRDAASNIAAGARRRIVWTMTTHLPGRCAVLSCGFFAYE
jgi:hypothetical protein